MTLFDNGYVSAAYYSDKNTIVNTSISALIAFRGFKPADCLTWVSEVSPNLFPEVKTLYMGKERIAPTETSILNLRNIYDKYHEVVKSGLLTVTSSTGNAFITITDYNWRYITDKNEFERIYANGDSLLSLFENR